jgi:hypothetical protein
MLSACGKKLDTTGPFEKDLLAYANSVPEFKTDAKNVHSLDPAVLFGYSYYLFKNNRKDESIFVYYLAQLRAKILMDFLDEDTLDIKFFEKAAQESGLVILGNRVYLSTPGRNSLYQNIMQGLGQSINGYAGSKPNMWVEGMHKALEYEKANPSDYSKITTIKSLPKSLMKQAAEGQEAGLKKLIEHVEQNKKNIEKSKERTDVKTDYANGLSVLNSISSSQERSRLMSLNNEYPDSFSYLDREFIDKDNKKAQGSFFIKDNIKFQIYNKQNGWILSAEGLKKGQRAILIKNVQDGEICCHNIDEGVCELIGLIKYDCAKFGLNIKPRN